MHYSLLPGLIFLIQDSKQVPSVTTERTSLSNSTSNPSNSTSDPSKSTTDQLSVVEVGNRVLNELMSFNEREYEENLLEMYHLVSDKEKLNKLINTLQNMIGEVELIGMYDQGNNEKKHLTKVTSKFIGTNESNKVSKFACYSLLYETGSHRMSVKESAGLYMSYYFNYVNESLKKYHNKPNEIPPSILSVLFQAEAFHSIQSSYHSTSIIRRDLNSIKRYLNDLSLMNLKNIQNFLTKAKKISEKNLWFCGSGWYNEHRIIYEQFQGNNLILANSAIKFIEGDPFDYDDSPNDELYYINGFVELPLSQIRSQSSENAPFTASDAYPVLLADENLKKLDSSGKASSTISILGKDYIVNKVEAPTLKNGQSIVIPFADFFR